MDFADSSLRGYLWYFLLIAGPVRFTVSGIVSFACLLHNAVSAKLQLTELPFQVSWPWPKVFALINCRPRSSIHVRSCNSIALSCSSIASAFLFVKGNA